MSNCNELNFRSGNKCTQVDIGFDYSKTITYTDNAGAAIDLTGFVLDCDIKDVLGGSVIIAMPEVANDQTTCLYIADRTTGVILFQIKKADTAITPASYPYEITITNPSTDESIFLQGIIEFANRGF